MNLEAFVNVRRYLTQPAKEVVLLQKQFAEQGWIVLREFLSPEGVDQARSEIDSLATQAHRQDSLANIHLRHADIGAPDSDPRAIMLHTSIHVVPYDVVDEESLIAQLYALPGFRKVISDHLSLEKVYPYADPLGAVNIVRMLDGDEQGWHFDMTDFVVSLTVRAPVRGGHFEMFVPNGREGELKQLLRGQCGDRLRRLDAPVGSLILFKGRNILHRVSQVAGPFPRDVVLFGFDSRDGVDSTAENKLRRYGRVAPKVIS